MSPPVHSEWHAYFRVPTMPILMEMKRVHIVRDLRNDDGWLYCVASVDVDSIWPSASDEGRWIEYIP